MNLIKELGIVDMGTYKVKKAVYACPKCGAEKDLICSQVDTGRITQCRSCASKQQKQGHKGTRLYSIWQNMKARCKGSTSHNKKYYTDKGITVCDEWVNDFPAFKAWALQNGYDDTLSIDRKDNNSGYSESNCRWATQSTQVENTRILKSTNTSGYRGVSKNGSKWRARIQVEGKEKSLGTFDNILDAAKAYDRYILENNLNNTINGVLNE